MQGASPPAGSSPGTGGERLAGRLAKPKSFASGVPDTLYHGGGDYVANGHSPDNSGDEGKPPKGAFGMGRSFGKLWGHAALAALCPLRPPAHERLKQLSRLAIT